MKVCCVSVAVICVCSPPCVNMNKWANWKTLDLWNGCFIFPGLSRAADHERVDILTGWLAAVYIFSKSSCKLTFILSLSLPLPLHSDLQDWPEGVQQPIWLQAPGGAGHPQRGPLHPRRHQLWWKGETGTYAGKRTFVMEVTNTRSQVTLINLNRFTLLRVLGLSLAARCSRLFNNFFFSFLLFIYELYFHIIRTVNKNKPKTKNKSRKTGSWGD